MTNEIKTNETSTDTYQVNMLAFNNNDPRLGGIDSFVMREVEVPFTETIMKSTDEILELIYTYGQNHIQPKNCESISVGDVIILPTDECPNEKYPARQLWLVAGCGFERITETEYLGYMLTQQYDRRGHEVRNR